MKERSEDKNSAGLTMVTAPLSQVLKELCRQQAMTGELTLTGTEKPVGSSRAKVLDARRSIVTEVIQPEASRKDSEELPEHLLMVRGQSSSRAVGRWQQ